jgi:methylated-DNA-protein-cysteine methyltransferase related protein
MGANDPANFYAAVYHLVAQIPPGKVTTYGQIARWLGHPSAARAVGYALHALLTGSDIPWQRVINAAGRVSSRCDRHYEGIQRALLEAEGIRFDTYGTVDLQRVGRCGPLAGEHRQRQERGRRCGNDQRHRQADDDENLGCQPQGGHERVIHHIRDGIVHVADEFGGVPP